MRERPVSTRCAPLDGPPRGQDRQPVTEFKKDIPCVFNKPGPSPLDIRNCAPILKGVNQLTGSRSFRKPKRTPAGLRKGEKSQKPENICKILQWPHPDHSNKRTYGHPQVRDAAPGVKLLRILCPENQRKSPRKGHFAQ